jgi:hypothetical protein
VSKHFTEADAPIDDAVLDECEAWLGFRLPTQYREFMKWTNGGRPPQPALTIPGMEAGPADITGFYSVLHPVQSCALVKTFEVLSDRLPRSMLPIAYDGVGNQFCIVARGPGVGRIFYAEFEYVGARGVLHLAAEDIQSFLAALHD